MKFLKNFGWGLLTIILLPLLAALLLLGALYLVGVFFYEMGHALVRFFRGEKGPLKLPEDLIVESIKAERLRQQMPKEEAPTAPVAPSAPGATHVYIQQNYYQKNQPDGAAQSPLPEPSVEPAFGSLPHMTPQSPKPEPKVIDLRTPEEKKPEPLALEGVSPEVKAAIEEALAEKAKAASLASETQHEVIDITAEGNDK